MKNVTLVLMVMVMAVAGCSQPTVTPAMRSLMVQFAVESAIAVNRVDHQVSPLPDVEPETSKCCGECGGTGWVKSGDGHEDVRCDCPDSCECKRGGTGSVEASEAEPVPEPAKPAVCPRCLNSRKVLSGRKIVACEACKPGCSDGSCRPTK